ncbi:MAG TPA: hypothetical protein VMV10_20305 [Pirellulales bacterium]|nr:hypothetical protein [Pirellulales bacterium]
MTEIDPQSPSGPPGPFESLGRKIDERPEVQAAEEAVRRAREEFEKAQELYHRLREEASEGFEHLREKNVGDLIEGAMGFVRKNPGPGVLIAAALGFFFGRLFSRR